MSYTLRPYQQEAVDRALDFFAHGDVKDTPIIVAPTGAGKSLYIGSIANTLKENVLVLQPSKELLEQNYAKFAAYGGKAAIYSASLNSREIDAVTFATIGSIKTKPSDFAHVRYVLIDECHLVPPSASSMFMQFLGSLPNVKTVGLTATPFRLKKYTDPFSGRPYSQINLLPRERPRFFNKFLHVTQIDHMLTQGFMSPIRYIPMEWSNGDLRVNTTGAEYTEKSVDFALQQQRVHERLPDMVRQSIEKGRKHRIVFVRDVAHAMALAQRVPDSACVHAGTKKKEREAILTAFKAGRIKTVFNVAVLTVGFDFPALDTIIIARPTMSLALYMQMIGRGVRPHESKQDCVVVDMCGNHRRFGKVEDIKYTVDTAGKWVVRNGERALSGVPLNKNEQ